MTRQLSQTSRAIIQRLRSSGYGLSIGVTTEGVWYAQATRSRDDQRYRVRADTEHEVMAALAESIGATA